MKVGAASHGHIPSGISVPPVFTSSKLTSTKSEAKLLLPSCIHSFQFDEDTSVSFDAIIDVRSYNLYCDSHLKEAVNICVPTTLSKRKSYPLESIVELGNVSPKIKKRMISKIRGTSDEDLPMRILFYDDNLNSKNVQFVLYRLLIKFLDRELEFELYMLEGGLLKVKLSNFSSSVLTSSEESNGEGSLSSFYLPSASSYDEKFVASIKRSYLDLPSSKSILSVDVDSYPHTLRKPVQFDQIKNRLPKWLEFTKGTNRDILKYLAEKFSKIEQLEHERIATVVSKTEPVHMPYICSPNGLCPSCDQTHYSLPKGAEYGHKNRYNNIWPYEHSRVKLVGTNDDYINANFVGEYIATQNPLPNTMGDFWQIVWLNQVSIVVRLSDSAAAAYYNDDGLTLGKMKLNTLEITRKRDFTVRKIKLTKKETEESRNVYHVSFERWPDFGLPPDLDSLIDLIKYKSDLAAAINSNGPVLVHCSAGCGRTGVFIAIDTTIRSIMNQKEDIWGINDVIYKAVQYQRTRRISMVQNFDQFIVCYEIVLRYLVSTLNE